MMEILTNLFDQISHPELLQSLVLLGIKSLVVTSFALLVCSLMRRSTAANRSIIVQFSFLALLLLPLISILTPGWTFTLSNPNWQSIIPTVNSSAVQMVNAIETTPISIPLTFWVASIWFGGFLFGITKIMIGIILSHIILKNSSQINNSYIESITNQIINKLQIKRTVHVVLSKHVSIPITTGLFHQYVILPHTAINWTNNEIKMALVHEMAHIKRMDIFWILISSVVGAIYWFNPLVWICRKQLILDAEKASDNFVLNAGTDPFSYAEHLLMTARNYKKTALVSPLTVNMANRTQLEGRLMSIMSKRKKSITAKSSVVRIAMIASLAIIIPLASVQLMAGDNDNKVVTKQKKVEFAKQEQLAKKIAALEKKLQDVHNKYVDSEFKNKDLGKKEFELKVELAKLYEMQESNKKEKVLIASDYIPSPDDFIALDTYPEMLSQSTPDYPEKAKQAGIEGVVYVQSLLDTKGIVKEVKVGKTSGNKMLDKAAVEAAYKCKFTPGMQGDNPVHCWITYKVDFVLAKKGTGK